MSHSCSNSSNLSGNVNIRNVTNSGARLLMSHELSGFSGGRVSGYIGDDGVTAGDAIRYDVIQYLSDGVTDSPSYLKYRKAQADSPENSEIVGVIESIDDGIVSVVLSGQIIFPDDKFVNSTHIDETLGTSGATGGNDIYFLSEVTAGAIQNLAPISPTKIAKPILQKAADGTFNAHVVNYIGYQIGGQVVATDDTTEDLTFLTLPVSGDESLPQNHFDLSDWTYLPLDEKAPNYNTATRNTYNNIQSKFPNDEYGNVWLFELDTSVPSSWNGKRVTVGSFSGVVHQRNNARYPGKNYLYVKTDGQNPPAAGTIRANHGQNAVYTKSPQKIGLGLPVLPRSTKQMQVSGPFGKRSTLLQKTVAYISPEQGTTAITIPSNVTIDTVTAKTLKINNSSVNIEDLGTLIDNIVTQSNSNKTKLDGSGSTGISSVKK